ncbi:MAG: RNA polymerase sigma factor [Oligosphaeraceae bacterium]
MTPPKAPSETEPSSSDEALIRLCLDGSDEAFDQLYQRYRLPLFGYLHKLLPRRNDLTEDLFQQTWIRALRSLNRYRHQEKFLAWLCRIAHNLAMDHFRSPGEAVTGELPPSLASNLPLPDAELSRRELTRELETAILRLPPEQQDIIRLREQGMAFKDIARLRHISINTALGRMRYAVLNLRKFLSPHL